MNCFSRTNGQDASAIQLVWTPTRMLNRTTVDAVWFFFVMMHVGMYATVRVMEK